MARLPLLLVVPLLTFAATAVKADFYSHRYGGLSIQNSEFSGLCSDASRFVSGLNRDEQSAVVDGCADNGAGLKLYGGWQWTPYMAVEADFRQTSTSELTFNVRSPELPQLNIKERIQTRMGNAYLVGHWPLNRSGLSVFGKLGGGFWLSQVDVRQRGQAIAMVRFIDGSVGPMAFPVDASFSENGSGFHWGYGAGVSYRFRDRWTVRAEWELFPEIGSNDLRGEYEVESASLGWTMHF
ncbi:outer membrane beta-barrel protein [Microbulbifer sp. ALW1]|uniref:outer membrane beta-barrel protein n=1 Tax=Microbulbifer sp. (strain ALW1) TaxID=1516059 RepID=UPI001358A006|nr:outer membrane beta-barrel protein [Microbulbifer sp. ALW1]